jgi:hypothetical protein
MDFMQLTPAVRTGAELQLRTDRFRVFVRSTFVVLLQAGFASPALAACNQELAVYSEPEASASLEFTPAGDTGSSHTFKIKFPENSVILDGVVLWTEDVARPMGIVMHKCPDGDVTGPELDACTVWQGVIYAVDGRGNIGLLPPEGAAAAEQLLLPDFAPALRQSSAYGMAGVSKMPWDVFKMSGCQE